MSKFSEAERQNILDQSRDLLSREPFSPGAKVGGGHGRDDNVISALSPADPPIVETLNQRHRRELDERDAQWAIERRRERARDDLGVDRKIAVVRAELEELRGHVIEIAKSASTGVERINNAIGELERKSDAVDRIEKLFARLESKIDQALPRERGSIDLPNPLHPARVN
jgi:hypothetical protein